MDDLTHPNPPVNPESLYSGDDFDCATNDKKTSAIHPASPEGTAQFSWLNLSKVFRDIPETFSFFYNDKPGVPEHSVIDVYALPAVKGERPTQLLWRMEVDLNEPGAAGAVGSASA